MDGWRASFFVAYDGVLKPCADRRQLPTKSLTCPRHNEHGWATVVRLNETIGPLQRPAGGAWNANLKPMSNLKLLPLTHRSLLFFLQHGGPAYVLGMWTEHRHGSSQGKGCCASIEHVGRFCHVQSDAH